MKEVSYLVLVEFLEGLGLDLLDGIDLARGDVLRFVDLRVFLAGAEEVDLLKVLLPEHL